MRRARVVQEDDADDHQRDLPKAPSTVEGGGGDELLQPEPGVRRMPIPTSAESSTRSSWRGFASACSVRAYSCFTKPAATSGERQADRVVEEHQARLRDVDGGDGEEVTLDKALVARRRAG